MAAEGSPSASVIRWGAVIVTAEIKSKAAELEARILDVLRHRVGKNELAAKEHDWFTAAISMRFSHLSCDRL